LVREGDTPGRGFVNTNTACIEGGYSRSKEEEE
jgi:hypothetical protein